nr:hypothetical protein [uncultured Acetatifactor sp.]
MFCTGRQDTPQETLRGVLLYGPLDTCLPIPQRGRRRRHVGRRPCRGTGG